MSATTSGISSAGMSAGSSSSSSNISSSPPVPGGFLPPTLGFSSSPPHFSPSPFNGMGFLPSSSSLTPSSSFLAPPGSLPPTLPSSLPAPVFPSFTSLRLPSPPTTSASPPSSLPPGLGDLSLNPALLFPSSSSTSSSSLLFLPTQSSISSPSSNSFSQHFLSQLAAPQKALINRIFDMLNSSTPRSRSKFGKEREKDDKKKEKDKEREKEDEKLLQMQLQQLTAFTPPSIAAAALGKELELTDFTSAGETLDGIHGASYVLEHLPEFVAERASAVPANPSAIANPNTNPNSIASPASSSSSSFSFPSSSSSGSASFASNRIAYLYDCQQRIESLLKEFKEKIAKKDDPHLPAAPIPDSLEMDQAICLKARDCIFASLHSVFLTAISLPPPAPHERRPPDIIHEFAYWLMHAVVDGAAAAAFIDRILDTLMHTPLPPNHPLAGKPVTSASWNPCTLMWGRLVLSELHAEMNRVNLTQASHHLPLRGFQLLCHSSSFLDSMLSQHNFFSFLINGFRTETETVLGVFFKLSCLNDEKSLSDLYFSTPMTMTEVERIFVLGRLNRKLDRVYEILTEIFVRFLSHSALTRSALLAWLATMLLGNWGRTRMRTPRRTVSTDGFLLNIGAVMLFVAQHMKIFHPCPLFSPNTNTANTPGSQLQNALTNGKEKEKEKEKEASVPLQSLVSCSMLGVIDPFYPLLPSRVDVKDETKIAALPNEENQWLNLLEHDVMNLLNQGPAGIALTPSNSIHLINEVVGTGTSAAATPAPLSSAAASSSSSALSSSAFAVDVSDLEIKQSLSSKDSKFLLPSVSLPLYHVRLSQDHFPAASAPTSAQYFLPTPYTSTPNSPTGASANAPERATDRAPPTDANELLNNLRSPPISPAPQSPISSPSPLFISPIRSSSAPQSSLPTTQAVSMNSIFPPDATLRVANLNASPRTPSSPIITSPSPPPPPPPPNNTPLFSPAISVASSPAVSAVASPMQPNYGVNSSAAPSPLYQSIISPSFRLSFPPMMKKTQPGADARISAVTRQRVLAAAAVAYSRSAVPPIKRPSLSATSSGSLSRQGSLSANLNQAHTSDIVLKIHPPAVATSSSASSSSTSSSSFSEFSLQISSSNPSSDFSVSDDQLLFRFHAMHEGIICDSCRVKDFTGPRMKCANCQDFDCCAKCEQKLYAESLGLRPPSTATYSCPLPGCKAIKLTELALQEHLSSATHDNTDAPLTCPICHANGTHLPLTYQQLVQHLQHSHSNAHDPLRHTFVKIPRMIPTPSRPNFTPVPAFTFLDSDGDNWKKFIAADDERKRSADSDPDSVADLYQKTVVHPGMHCNLCSQPIVGVRYTCSSCVNFHLCSACESKLSDPSTILHDPSHIFFKFRRPIAPDAAIATVSVLYPSCLRGCWGFNLETEWFFLIAHCLHVGLSRTVQRYHQLVSQLEAESDPRKTEAIMKVKLCVDAQLLHPKTLHDTLSFYSMMARWMLSILPMTPSYSTFGAAAHLSTTALPALPLTSAIPMEWAALPEYFLEDMAEFLLFSCCFSYDSLNKHVSEVVPMIHLCLVLIASPQFVNNPYTRAKLVNVICSLSENHTPNAAAMAATYSNLIRSDFLAISALPHALLSLFADIEHISDSNIERYNIRHTISGLLHICLGGPNASTQLITQIPSQCFAPALSFRDQLENECIQNPSLVMRFLHSCVSDLVYLTDESLLKASQLHTLQLALARQPQHALRRADHEKVHVQLRILRTASVLTSKMIWMAHSLSIQIPSIRWLLLRNDMVDRFTPPLHQYIVKLSGSKREMFAVDKKDFHNQHNAHQNFPFNPEVWTGLFIDIFLAFAHDAKEKQQSASSASSVRACSPLTSVETQHFPRGDFMVSVVKDGFDEREWKTVSEVLVAATEETKAEKPTRSSASPSPSRAFQRFDELNSFVHDCIRQSSRLREESEELGDIPDEFLDPLLSTLMEDPVLLPSGMAMDRLSITRHLASKSQDPFTRQPLSVEQLKDATELKEKIESWKNERKRIAKLGKSHTTAN